MEQTIKDITEILINPQYHDVEFIFPKEKGIIIKANRCFLVKKSEVWEKMFCGENWKDSGKTETIVKITIKDTESEMFKLFLRYCYLNEITLTQTNVLPILLISETYMHKQLIEQVKSYIQGEKKDYTFLLRILGDMSELGEIDIESIKSLKDFIKKKIKENPDYFLYNTNFSNLSPVIKDTIYDLFSLRALPLPESCRLNRIIEYGEALKNSPENADKEIKDIIKPVLKFVNFMELSGNGFQILIKYSILSIREAFKYLLEIMTKNHINWDHLAKSKRLDYNRFTFKGSTIARLNINGKTDPKAWEEQWCLDINSSKELIITLDQPQIMCYITCELKEPYEGTAIEIRYSEKGTDWQVDSLHYPTFDTRRKDRKLHQFFIKTFKGHQYWKLFGKNTMKVLGRNLQIFIAE